MYKHNLVYLIITTLCAIIASIITALIFNAYCAKAIIDAWAFLASIFLIIEASIKIYLKHDRFWPNQFLRLLRVIIGICVFTIHTCQVIYGI